MALMGDFLNSDICIFEMGKGFYKTDNEYKEQLKLAVLMTGDYYLDINNKKVDFYTIKGILEELLDYLGYNNRYSIMATQILTWEIVTGERSSIDYDKVIKNQLKKYAVKYINRFERKNGSAQKKSRQETDVGVSKANQRLF